MGEGNHQPTAAKPSATNRMGLIIGGTVVVLFAGLVLMQTFRSQPSQAAVEAPAKTAPTRKVEYLARVGKESISYDLVAQEAVARHGKEILDDLINRMIIQQKCEEANVEVTEAEINAEVTRIAKRFNLDTDQWYKMLQAERNISPQQYRQSVIWPMLSLKKLAGEQVDITEEEMDKAFVRNYGSRVKARLILLDNQRRAQEVWDKCKQNPDGFEKLAEEFSVDSSSRALGGSIPPIPMNSGNETLEKAAFKLKEGEISGLIELQTGRYAILKSEGKTEPVVNDISEVREQLYEELFEAKTQQSVAKVFEQIKKEVPVDNYITQTSTGQNRPFTQATPGTIQPASATKPAGTIRTGSNAAPGTATLRK
jgi:foldase protein PrsA